MAGKTIANKSPLGFTLIEVAFAILILAGALVVLLGLQSASIQRSVRDHNKQQAMLISRYIFSTLETRLAEKTTPIDPGQIYGTPEEVINSLLAGAAAKDSLLDPDQRFTISMNISYWPVPGLPKDAVKRIVLTVAWGNSSLDALTTTYFIPAE